MAQVESHRCPCRGLEFCPSIHMRQLAASNSREFSALAFLGTCVEVSKPMYTFLKC